MTNPWLDIPEADRISMSAESLAIVKDAMDRLPAASMELAARGWVLPLSLTPKDIVEWSSMGPEQLDAAFVAWYSEDGGRRINDLLEALLERPTLEPWRTLLEQVARAYERADYVVTVPALITVLEGVVMAGLGTGTKPGRTAQNIAAECERALPGGTAGLIWRANARFIDELYKHARFDGNRPDVLNRHWVLHGRDAATWGQCDSLRLFQAIDTVSTLLRGQPA